MDEPVSPSSGQEAAVGAKTNSIDLREMGILLKREEGGVGMHASSCPLTGIFTPVPGLAVPTGRGVGGGVSENLKFQIWPQQVFMPGAPDALCLMLGVCLLSHSLQSLLYYKMLCGSHHRLQANSSC